MFPDLYKSLTAALNSRKTEFFQFMFSRTRVYLLLLPLLLFVLPSQSHSAVEIMIDHAAEGKTINDNILGTNLPTWINRFNSTDATFQQRMIKSGATLVRIPGGSWSNGFDWEPCEKYDQCSFGASEGWIIRPTEFINFLKTTGQQAIFTLNPNITSKEAAALVAFFNGDVSSSVVIGVDINGKDWGTVGDWAKLRRDNGNPEPFPLLLWEFGNEVYGGKQGQGKDCLSWGWEEVWTCDGTEYVLGIKDNHGNYVHEGYDAFRSAMKAVEPSIQLGAVGISEQNGWTNWGNEVITAAGDDMDFYIVHQYAYYNPPADRKTALAEPQSTWQDIIDGVHSAFDQYWSGRRIPIGVTEYNMFSSWDRDPGQWMNQAVNMLHLADTIGQMISSGVSFANQWAFANGTGSNGSDYGLVSTVQPYAPYPSYYVFPLWSAFGQVLLPVTTTSDPSSEMSVYAGQIDQDTRSVLAINKTSSPIEATIAVEGKNIQQGFVDQAVAQSLASESIIYNLQTSPSIDISDIPPLQVTPINGAIHHSFPQYSITLMKITLSDDSPTAGGDGVIPSFLLLLDNGGSGQSQK